MTDLNTTATLDDIDDEDIFDVVIKLEKSFGLNFGKNAFSHVNTFGQLCDVFEEHLNYEHRDDCTKQQAYYRVREALSSTLKINRNNIRLNTKLYDLFPSRGRRRKGKEFKKAVGVAIKILTYPAWLKLTLVISFLLALAALFFDWKIALGGLMFILGIMNIAEKLGRTLHIKTVRELTDKLAKEHYADVRRTKGTCNKQEVLQTIINTFSNDLTIQKLNLTRESTFSWAKTPVTSNGLENLDIF